MASATCDVEAVSKVLRLLFMLAVVAATAVPEFLQEGAQGGACPCRK